jgi:hypothetical protein
MSANEHSGSIRRTSLVRTRMPINSCSQKVRVGQYKLFFSKYIIDLKLDEINLLLVS